MTLTEFLLARIAEDERHARKLAETDSRPILALATTVNHPERLLAECEAKRRIAALHTDGGNSQGYTDKGYGEYEHACETCGTFGEYGDPWPCLTLRAVALPYRDHPDYQPEWKI